MDRMENGVRPNVHLFDKVPKVKSPPIEIGQAHRSSLLVLISNFNDMKRLGVFQLPLDGIIFHHRLPTSILSGCSPTICWFPLIYQDGERRSKS